MESINPSAPKNVAAEFEPQVSKESIIQTNNGEKKVEELKSEQQKACTLTCSNVTKWVFVAVAAAGVTAAVFGLLVYFVPQAGLNIISSDTGFFVANAGFAAGAISGVVLIINQLVSGKETKEVDEDENPSWISRIICCNSNVKEKNEGIEIIESKGNRVTVEEADKTEVDLIN